MTDKVLWFFGLSGSGKTTLSQEVLKWYQEHDIKSILLDGDIVRKGICKDLGFSKKDRSENVRRIAEICHLMLQAGVSPIVAAITPYESDRKNILEIMGKDNMVFVHVDCTLEACEKRDPKGLYKMAREGKLEKFTGISDVFEKPSLELPVITLNTMKVTKEKTLQELYSQFSVYEV